MTAQPNRHLSVMRAWRSAKLGLEALELGHVVRPLPGRGEATVKVATAGLNFSDLLMIEDRYQVRPDRPFVPGQEIAGTVVTTGEGSKLRVGDRVASKVVCGGFAEFVTVRDDVVIRIPEPMSFAEAAALPIVYTTAMVALTESTRILPGETVLVLAAAGGIGLASVEVARYLDGSVIAAAGGDEKCALARAHGAKAAIDYRNDGWVDEVRRLTRGRGANVIVDPVGGEVSKAAIRLLDWGGRLLIVGFSSGEIPQIPANRLLLRRASALGVYWNHDRDGPMLARVAGRLSEIVSAGAIRPHIGAALRFEDLPRGLTALAARKTMGKSILNVVEEGFDD